MVVRPKPGHSFEPMLADPAPRTECVGRCAVPFFCLLSASEFRTMGHARGTFEVKVTPQTMAHAAEAGLRLGRMSLDKRYHGDLEATAVGEMLAGGTSEKTSAGYVAMEEVRGTLNGRRGSFLLQHSGTMNRGTPALTVTVVPDSGTEELVGLSGSLTIIVEGKKHSYEFEFSLPGAPWSPRERNTT